MYFTKPAFSSRQAFLFSIRKSNSRISAMKKGNILGLSAQLSAIRIYLSNSHKPSDSMSRARLMTLKEYSVLTTHVMSTMASSE